MTFHSLITIVNMRLPNQQTIRKSIYLACLGSCIVLLTACGTTGSFTSVYEDKVPVNTQNPSNYQTIESLLTAAKRAKAPEKQALQIKAAGKYIEQKQFAQAEELLKSINSAKIASNNYTDYSKYYAFVLIERGAFEDAQSLLFSDRLSAQESDLSISQQIAINNLRATCLSRLGNHLASVEHRTFIDPLLVDRAVQKENRAAIWDALMRVPYEELEAAKTQASSQDLLGWLDLASIAKKNYDNLQLQFADFYGWKMRWANHPASKDMPGDLNSIQQLVNSNAQQIALLLPLSGKLANYGRTILDGFMAAYFDAKEGGAQTPNIRVYDSSQVSRFGEVYRQAITDGAQAVIGPLQKDNVVQLYQIPGVIPTLALNRINLSNRYSLQIFQFGLSLDDEAEQIADIAYLDKHQKALIITPRGQWGQQIAQQFSSRWQQLGGEIVDTINFGKTKELSQQIKGGLQIPASEQRARRLRQVTGLKFQFEPRRRQDIDMIFMVAKPRQARSIKPILAYHYASKIPVYATSRTYGAVDNPSKDIDLNGIKFTDMPWVLDNKSPLKTLIKQETNTKGSYLPMYALGIDSFKIFPRLALMQKLPDSSVYGLTGTLKLNNDNQLKRRVLLGTFANGTAKNIPFTDRVGDIEQQGRKHNESSILESLEIIQ